MREGLGRLGFLGMVLVSTACGITGCGKPQETVAIRPSATRIIGGTDATGEEAFAKSIVLVYNDFKGSICTGSILSDKIVLTAAHCLEGPVSFLRLVFSTELDINRDIDDANFTAITRLIDAVEVSPLWAFRKRETTNRGDIALLKFSGGLPEGFRSVSLLADGDELTDGATVLLAGYGVDSGTEETGSGRLRYVETTIKDADFHDTEILVDQTQGHGACYGDSGGPAYVQMNNRWVLFGVTNHGIEDKNNDCSGYAAYASIPFWKGWILQTARALVLEPTPPEDAVQDPLLASASN